MCINHRVNDEGEPLPASKIAVVIPCYKVKAQILGVLAAIGPVCHAIYVVDDRCPELCGDYVEANCHDERVRVLRNAENLGVGGAVMAGYSAAIEDGADVIVKLDGDGQMDPDLIPSFVHPLLSDQADYTKGNRFWDLREIRRMPRVRRIGNLILSFLSKLSTGYWDIFDPTNGYTAIHARIAENLPFEVISRRYFFESDMLFRLNILRAVVLDVPMHSCYADEVSNLKIKSILFEFSYKHLRNFSKRIAYNYFLRDLSLASFELVASVALLAFGLVYGVVNWTQSNAEGHATPVGTIMICTVAIISGLQFLLAFLGHDIAGVPRGCLHALLRKRMPSGRTNVMRTTTNVRS